MWGQFELDDDIGRALYDNINELCEGKIQAPQSPSFSCFFVYSFHQQLTFFRMARLLL
jgi:hypothetical protein